MGNKINKKTNKNTKPIKGEPAIVTKIIENQKKSQIVVVTDINSYYQYDYGVINCHSGSCHKNDIRKLTDVELELYKNNKFNQLPQQFYQSGP